MRDEFEPESGAKAWQLSTSSPIMLSALRSSLDIFDEVGISKLRNKSIKLTGYLRELIENKFEIITPSNSGAQLSVRVPNKKLFDYLHGKGVYMDWREPDVVRLAPVPLYNTFEEVFNAAQLMIQFL
jgi:kynureninase